MSKYNFDKDLSAIFSASEAFVERCLIKDGSLFSEQSLWTVDLINEVKSAFMNVEIPDDATFIEKLEYQMLEVSPLAKCLMAEVLWILLLFTTASKASTKRMQVTKVWGWSDKELSGRHEYLCDDVLSGVGNPGPAFSAGRWRELAFLFDVAFTFKNLPLDERKNIAEDPWLFSDWLVSVPREGYRQLRHMLRYMFFPDHYERIVVTTHKKEMIEHFLGESVKSMSGLGDKDLDEKLYFIRTEMENKYGENSFDFYRDSNYKGKFPNHEERIITSEVIDFFPTVTQFLEQTKTENLAYAHYLNSVYGLTVRVSFGKGNLARMPWISFLGEGQKTSKGIYPGFLFCKEKNSLLLTYGSSEENNPLLSWPENDCLSTKEYLEEEYGFMVPRYGHSKVFKSYDVTKPIDKETLNKDLFDIVQQYKAVLNQQNIINEPTPAYRKQDTKMPTNQIIYGPPGTGKTFKLQNILKNQYTDNAVIQDKNVWLSDKIDSLNWFEILVLVLLDSNTPIKVPDIISHEYYQIKAKLNNRTANLKQTAWAALQTHTIANSNTVKYEKRVEPLVFDKDENSLWFIIDKEDGQLEEYSSLLASLKQGPQKAETIKRFEFVTFHQSYGYEEFIEGLRPITNDNGDISYEVKPGVFKRLCKRAEADKDHQYALVIDEINRGNISKIFGELISLIETDKREGCEHELTVTLPYSGLPFLVPKNVDIIGSMNTADRSLTHIDVALRRRFEFKELRTNYSLLENDAGGINIKHMLYAMNQRIELLLDREHILGHALLMKVKTLTELERAFKSSIMPLLEEYFFEDWGQINQVLNSNGFIEEQKDARSTWLDSTDEYAAKSYKVNFNALSQTEKYQQIYTSVDSAAFIDCDVE